MFEGGDRELLSGWSGTLGGLPVFGFQAAAGSDPDGPLYVVAVRLPGINFPELTLMEAGLAGDAPTVPIDPVFDLYWQVVARNPAFARDLIGPAMQEVLTGLKPDFSQIWVERDAVLLSARGDVSATALDRYLHLLRRLVDTMPTRVLNALRPDPALLRIVPRPAPPRPAGQLPLRVPASTPAPPALAASTDNEWARWATRRGWLHFPNGREIAERFHRGPVQGGRYIDAFAGRFGDLPCFGWRTVSGTGGEAAIRQVVCVRKPGVDHEAVRVTLDDAILTELVGSGDIEVGDADFDARWRVTSDSEDSARAALTPAIWKVMGEPFVPRFEQLWIEHDVAAVITDGPIAPDRVDEYLKFLHKLVTLMGR
ncbi:hypothetical protein G7085_13065 [Tessaracoccus sp. HDW20]|uniref:hypothetical protein n=1 Tax=Tessaracoccus coleopterorum TaxID=2714950 RepID=UPI0018D45DEC|nr:hypothetical protein [Tessaracoccus coleopterorum]NHB85244.1 hypothetical protein [Tessaracoccus coleopterorum]